MHLLICLYLPIYLCSLYISVYLSYRQAQRRYEGMPPAAGRRRRDGQRRGRVDLSTYIDLCESIPLSLYRYIYTSIFIYLSIHSSTNLCVSTYRSIHLKLYLHLYIHVHLNINI